MIKTDKTIHILGLEVFSRPRTELLNILEEKLLGSFPLQTIATPNPEQVVQARKDPTFLQALEQFDFLLPDGMGLVWASRMLKKRESHSLNDHIIAERITGVDVVVKLLQIAQRENLNVLVIGGRNYTSSQRNPSLLTLHDGLSDAKTGQNVWWTPGYADALHATPEEELLVSAAIEEVRPKIVFVALGAPAQELWIQSHRTELAQSGVSLAMAVGGTFDYLLGKVTRAPQMLQQLGLEWVYRLLQEPWRWRRQLRLAGFLKLVAYERVRLWRNDH